MALQLHVRSLSGLMTSLPAETSWTALRVKQALETIVKVPAPEVHLFLETRELHNSDVLGACPEAARGALDLSWIQAARWPRFNLDEQLVREAEDAASRYVMFTPWANNGGYVEPQRAMVPPNGTGPLGLGAGVMPQVPGPGPMPEPTGVVPPPYGAGPGGWAPVQPGMQVVPPEFPWGGVAGATGVAGGPMLGGVPGNSLAPAVSLGGMPPSGGPASVMAPMVGVASQESSKPEPASPSAVAALATSSAQSQPPPITSAVGEQQQITLSPTATAPEVAEDKPSPSATTAAEAASLSSSAAVVTGTAAEASGSRSAVASEGFLPALLETGEASQPSLPSPVTPTSATSTAAGAASPGGTNSWKSDYVNPNRTWANIVTKDRDLQEASTAGRQASSSSAAPVRREEDKGSRKDSIIDYLLFLAKYKAESPDGRVNGNYLAELPEDIRKYKQAAETGMNTNGRAKYVRRGMKNDANNCYVNVVIQSLLPCSALMQLLSHCAADPDRPFYTGMHKLCKEFHSRKPAETNEALNVLALPQVKRIISTWQQLGAQQDAGEFLFHLLNGLHEECKWKTLPEEGCRNSEDGSNVDEGGGEDAAKSTKEGDQVRPDVRSAGEHEDSPITRIFGGISRQSVQTRNAKAHSVSLEPFNNITLDISSVDSVWSALEAYCSSEAVNEGRATKRHQFKAVPKVMILNLKRFSYNKDTGRSEKIRKAVKFEEKLTFDRSWLVDEIEPQEYQLTAVICHHGDLVTGGHYNAAVRYNTEWYMYDDASVRQIELREVVNLTQSVYLLLYQCQNKIDIRP